MEPKEARERKRGLSPAAWTLVVLAIGVALGALLVFIPRPDRPGPGPGPGPRMFETAADIDVILSTVSLAFLVALLAVYAKTYSQTRAPFALGLIVVLAALLFQGLLTSPLFFGAFGHPVGDLGPFLLVADGFKTGAFAAFLYLSLQ